MASLRLFKKLTTLPSSFTTFHFRTAATSPVRTTKHLTRSILPLSLPAALRGSFPRRRDFHVHVSDEDFGKVIEENKEPKGQIAIVVGPVKIHDDEGLCVFTPMPGMNNNHVNVTIEKNFLLCIGTRPDGKPATCLPKYDPESLLPNKSYKRVNLKDWAWQQCGTYHCMVELPNKTYTPSEVEAKMKDCVLRVRFTNITKEDAEPFLKVVN